MAGLTAAPSDCRERSRHLPGALDAVIAIQLPSDRAL